MHGLFFYIGLGAGLAAACGLRPFLPVLLAGALASAPALGLSFSDNPFRFLQAGWWLLVVVIALIVAYALQLLRGLPALPDGGEQRGRAQPFAATLAGLAYGAAEVIEQFGTPDQKHAYCENMFTGKWGGTMNSVRPLVPGAAPSTRASTRWTMFSARS